MSDVAGAEGELVLDDAFLDANSADGTVEIDLEQRLPLNAFVPGCRLIPPNGPMGRFKIRGISVDGSATDADATTATVCRGLLNTQNATQRITRRYVCGITHPHKIRFVYPFGTTARGISFYL